MKKNTLLLLLSVLFISCSTSHTRVINSWRNKEKIKDKPLESIFIAVLTPHHDEQTIIENELAYKANQFDIKTYKSHNLFTKSFTKDEMPSKAELDRILETTKAKTLFTVTILSKDYCERYITGFIVRPGTGDIDKGYYDYFFRFFDFGSINITPTPGSKTNFVGYHVIDKVYNVETSLYDIETHELLWTATTETFNPYDLEGLTKEYTDKIFKKLERNKVIKKAEL